MYFSQVRIDPNDPETVLYAGVKLHKSTDGGKTVTLNATQTIHDDVHAIWIDPANSNHVIIGNDGGVAISWDMTKTWNFVHNIPVGLFYHVSDDMATPYNICGGMQDNYSWCGPSAVRGAVGIAGFNWATMQGGDGFVALQDPTDYRIAYSESQDGNMVRIDRVTGETISIRPQPNAGEPPLRWNWDTPLVMSPHDPKIIYAAANKVFRSANRGLNWETAGHAISPATTTANEIVTMGVKGSDIRIAKDDGIQAWPTIISFAESPKRAGVVYAGTDDGHLQVSRDGGRSWTDVADKIPGLPKGIWVSEVVPSRFDEGTVYATFDGHRQNDFETYIYVSHDFGSTWQSASGEPEGRGHQDDDRGPEEPRRPLRRRRDRPVRVDRSREELGAREGEPADGAHRRDHAAPARQRDDPRDARPRASGSSITSSRSRSTRRRRRPRPTRSCSRRRRTRCSAGRRAIATTSSGATRRSSARTRRGAAIISWLNKKQVGEVKLKITDAAGREVREISGTPLANSNKAGHPVGVLGSARAAQSGAAAGGGTRRSGQEGREGQDGQERAATGGKAAATPEPPATSPFGAGCPVATAGGGGGGFGGGPNLNGPYVIGGVYTVSLIVDGKTIESKPLRVNEDPEVMLTAVERKRMFDQAMEIHALQPRLIEAIDGARGADAAARRRDDGDRREERRAGGREGVARGADQGGRGARAEAGGAGRRPRRRRRRARPEREPVGEARSGEERSDGRHVAGRSDGARLHRGEGANAAGDRRPQRRDREGRRRSARRWRDTT